MLAGGNSWRIVETPTMQKVIRAKGYDAIRSMDEGVECLAVLAPNQLKGGRQISVFGAEHRRFFAGH